MLKPNGGPFVPAWRFVFPPRLARSGGFGAGAGIEPKIGSSHARVLHGWRPGRHQKCNQPLSSYPFVRPPPAHFKRVDAPAPPAIPPHPGKACECATRFDGSLLPKQAQPRPILGQGTDLNIGRRPQHKHRAHCTRTPRRLRLL
eukprot:scaffold13306_cov85-Isochrysis_galbana.AAC.1